ncbi:MAG: MATE family efflux transporter [Pseudomonadota bacterium]
MRRSLPMPRPPRLNEMERGRFLTGSTMGHVVRMTATGAFGLTFVFLVDAANLFWISQLGEPHMVAALGFAYAIQFFSISFGIGLTIATTAMVSRSIGAGDRYLARRQAGVGIVLAAMVQTCVASTVVFFRHELVALSGGVGETAELAAHYLAFTMPSLVPMAIGMVASGTLRAEGLAAKAMYVTFISGLILMIADPILIFWAGFGFDGAVIALVLFRVAIMLLGLFFAAYQHGLVAMPDGDAMRASAKPFALLAVPAIATQLSTPAGNYLLTIVIAPFGDEAVAAWAVVSRLTVLAFGGIFALSGAIGGIFGQNLGAGQYDRLRSTYRNALLFCVIYTLTMWALLAATTPLVIEGFGLSGLGAEVIRAFTSVGVGGFVFVGALFVSNAAFNNLGRPSRSTLMNWLKDGALTWPAATLLAGGFGAVGVIYGQAVVSVIMGGLAALWGWSYVRSLGPEANVVPPPARPWPSVDRYRRR